MSRSLPIRRKVLVAFVLPVLALGFATSKGVLDATTDAAEASEVVATSLQVRALQEASVAVGTERMTHALSDIQPDDSEELIVAAVETTDAAMVELIRFQDTVLLDRVWTALSAARSTPVGRYDNFGRSSTLLLDRAQQVDVAAGSGQAERSLEALQTMHLFVEAEDAAWVGFVNRTSEDLRSSATVLESFAVSGQLRAELTGVGRTRPSGPIQSAITSTAIMSDLQARAIEDVLNPQQMIVTDQAAILSHSDARVRWLAAIDQQAVDTQSELDELVNSALNRRNIFGLFGLFGLLVLAASAVALGQSITAPISAAATEAHKLVSDRLPTMSSSFGTIKQTRPRPIPAASDDEVGQLVGAINTIQDRFFDVAERESTARRQMSGRTVTIANRNAALLHELVRNVSAWRNFDTSPEVRQRLFGIDHIATRMQRNIEAGLVLGGGRSERRWTKPISAVNTARLALGEVVEFGRVDVSPMEEIRLHGLVAPDVAHVLAELIENGLAASAENDDSPGRVAVEGEWVSAGWAFLVHDSGSGLDAAERERVNRSLHTPGLTESPSTTNLGFILVGKAAARFGIDIRLIERPAGGTTARIVLPVDLIDPETVPAGRKRIDAGRGAALDIDPDEGLAPTGAERQRAADAYFTEPIEPDKKRRRGLRRSDTVDSEPKVAPAVSPLGEEHDVDSELKKLIGTAGVPEPAVRAQHVVTDGQQDRPYHS